MSLYKRIDDEGNLHSCILFEDKDGHHTIVNFNCWIGAATYLEVHACKRHMLVYHLTDDSYEVYGYQTDEHRYCAPVSAETLIIPRKQEEEYPF